MSADKESIISKKNPTVTNVTVGLNTADAVLL